MRRYFYILLLILAGIIWQANTPAAAKSNTSFESSCLCAHGSCNGCILSSFSSQICCSLTPLLGQTQDYLRPASSPSATLLLFFIATLFTYFVWQITPYSPASQYCATRSWSRLPDELLL